MLPISPHSIIESKAWHRIATLYMFLFSSFSFLVLFSEGGGKYRSFSSVWGGPYTANANLSQISKKANFPTLHVGGIKGDWRLSLSPGQGCLLLTVDGVGHGGGLFFHSLWSPASGVCTRERADCHHQAPWCWGSTPRLWAWLLGTSDLRSPQHHHCIEFRLSICM